MSGEMKPAVFLDRDGVITREKSYIRSAEELEIFDYSKECINIIHEKGYLAIVVTNQSGIARGFFSEEELIKMNHLLTDRIGVDAIYYCPHYPDGIIPQYAIPCDCRKPGIGMLKKACKSFKIDMLNSWMVGDRESDIQMGINAGLKTVLLESGYGSESLGSDTKPDYILTDLREFAELL